MWPAVPVSVGHADVQTVAGVVAAAAALLWQWVLASDDTRSCLIVADDALSAVAVLAEIVDIGVVAEVAVAVGVVVANVAPAGSRPGAASREKCQLNF